MNERSARVLRMIRTLFVGLVPLLALSVWALPVRVERVVTDPTTGEVRTKAAWSTGNWQALQTVWWQALVVSLLLGAVLALVWHGRRWTWAKIAAARFFAASLLVHCLLFLWLWGLPLARAVVERAEEIRVAQAAQLFEEQAGPSGEASRATFEKVADPTAHDAAPRELTRQPIAPLPAPEASDLPAATIPAHLVRVLPPERVLFVPLRRPDGERRPDEVPRRTTTASIKPVNVELDLPKPPPLVATPREKVADGPRVQADRQGPSAAPLPVPDFPNLPLPEVPLKVPAPLVQEVARRADLPPIGEVLFERLPRRATAIGKLARIDEPVAPPTLVLRQEEVRQRSVAMYGGTKESEEAVARGLAWLAARQGPGGSWAFAGPALGADAGTATSEAAATGIALLPFLGAGNTHQSGKHKETVSRALRWLMDKQQPDGTWPAPNDPRPMYGHGMASIALVEAYGMTQDPSLRGPAQRALEYIVKAQHEATGGWRYKPNMPADTSVVGWQLMALKSSEMAGLPVPARTLEGVKRWLASVEANRPTGGLFGYQSASPTPAMTAQGLLCLQYLGMRRDDPRMKAGTDYLLKNMPRPDGDTSYYWYHANQVMYHMQGEHWKAWNPRLRDLLVRAQVKDGALAGSWRPTDERERPGGRLYATALRLLMLEVYYRHLPLYQQLEK